METTKFRSLFPSVLTNNIISDSSLDRILGEITDFPDNYFYTKKYKINKTESEWQIEIPLPGASKDDVKISIKDSDKLIIEVDDETQWSNGEVRRFRLLPSADSEAISAEMKNGLLILTIPKKKSFQDKLVKIK